MGHLVLEQERSRVPETQEGCLLGTEFHDFQADGIIVMGISVIPPGRIGPEHGFPEVPVLAFGHEIGIIRYGHPELLLERIVLGEQIVSEGDGK